MGNEVRYPDCGWGRAEIDRWRLRAGRVGLEMRGSKIFRVGEPGHLGDGYPELREIVLMLERVAVVYASEEG